jgi:hypothetical protein
MIGQSFDPPDASLIFDNSNSISHTESVSTTLSAPIISEKATGTHRRTQSIVWKLELKVEVALEQTLC